MEVLTMTMLINDTAPQIAYIATAGQTVFAVPFEFFAVTDLVVERNGVALTYNPSPANNSQFSVIGANVEGGGSITLGAGGAALGERVAIYRDIPLDRRANYPQTGPFAVRALNTEQARQVAMIQQVAGATDRSIRLPKGESLAELPDAEGRTNTLVGFDEDGNFKQYNLGSFATSIAYATARSDVFSGNGAQTAFILTLSPGTVNNCAVFIDGVRQTPTTDYTLSGSTLTFTTAPYNGAAILVTYAEALTLAEADAQDVQFLPSGTGAVARTVQAKLRELPRSPADHASFANYMASIPTGFFSQNGADIQRVGRLMAGDAQRSDLAFPNVEQDWFTAFQVAQGFPNGAILAAQIAGITQAAPVGSGSAFGGLFASQSLPFNSAGTSCIGLGAFAVNNNATLATQAWGLYVEAHKTTAAVQSAIGIEVDTRQTVATVNPHPWQQGDVIGIQVASGAEFGSGLFDASAGIQFAPNPDKFKIGINFMHDSITGASGGTGNAAAIAMATGHEIRWYNSSGTQQAQIGCSTNGSNGPRLSFAANALQVFSQAGALGFEVNLVASAANYLGISNNSTTNPPNIVAFGSDTNIDIQLTPKGTGDVRFGTFTSNADAAVNGYVTIKDAAGNVRKLATIA